MTKKATETPYLNAKKEYNEREGSLNASHQLNKIINILCLLIALSAVGGLVYYRYLLQLVPFVVEVDKLGQTYAVARADRAAPADPRVIHATVARFITLARMVTPDATLQRKGIFDLYASLASSDPATFKMNEFLGTKSEENPFKRAAKETVEIQITSVLPQSDETWQVDWMETVRDRGDGSQLARYPMRALLNVYVVPPNHKTSEEQLRKNPLGIFIRDFSWSKQL